MIDAYPCVPPDVIVICIDANCRRYNKARDEIEGLVTEPYKERSVIACPDPHIERWYLADRESFACVVGKGPSIPRKKCERGWYKKVLLKAIIEAGHTPTLGGLEFAQKLVDEMDVYRATRNDRALKSFVEDLKNAMRRAERARATQMDSA